MVVPEAAVQMLVLAPAGYDGGICSCARCRTGWRGLLSRYQGRCESGNGDSQHGANELPVLGRARVALVRASARQPPAGGNCASRAAMLEASSGVPASLAAWSAAPASG